MHNGFVAEYEHLRHALILAIGPQLFENVQGTTDSELLFHLALKFGLEEDVIGSFERMAGVTSGPSVLTTRTCSNWVTRRTSSSRSHSTICLSVG